MAKSPAVKYGYPTIREVTLEGVLFSIISR